MVASDPGVEVVGEASDGAEAVQLARVLTPDVVLMDLRMRGMDGVAAIRELTRLGLPCRVVVLTTFDGDSDVLPAIEAGATGYLLKDAPRDDLLRAIRAAAVGDDRLQKQMQGVVVPESFTHGSSAQRVHWFRTGMESGQPASCD
ncbi:MAG: neutral zinc metallopeptidase, partial [Actinobacteria bacterium]|nr:neutral zinc metallopeptidase [Actinomycetota bacterium]